LIVNAEKNGALNAPFSFAAIHLGMHAEVQRHSRAVLKADPSTKVP
jgi:hypothetical protein